MAITYDMDEVGGLIFLAFTLGLLIAIPSETEDTLE